MKFYSAGFAQQNKKGIVFTYISNPKEAKKLRCDLGSLRNHIYNQANENDNILQFAPEKLKLFKDKMSCISISSGWQLDYHDEWDMTITYNNTAQNRVDCIDITIYEDKNCEINLILDVFDHDVNLNTYDPACISKSSLHKELLQFILDSMPISLITNALKIANLEVFNKNLKLITAKYLSRQAASISNNIPLDLKDYLNDISDNYAIDQSAPVITIERITETTAEENQNRLCNII